MGKEGRGRKAAGGRAGGRGGGRRGEGAGAAAAAAGFPASSPRCAPRSLGRCSPRRPASPRLGRPLWPRLLPPSGPALRFPLPPAPPPPSTQIPTPHPEPRSRRRRRRHTPLGLGLARLPRWPRPAPPRSHSPAGPLAPPPLPIDLPVRHRGPAHSPGLLPDWGRRGGPRARWLAAARDVSAPPPPPRLARLPPSAVPRQRNPPPRARAALGSGASPLQPPPREPVSGARSPVPRGRGPAGEGEAGRARGLGRRAARGPHGGAGGARGATLAPNKVCFDEKRLCLLFRVGQRWLVAPGSGRAMAAVSVAGQANKGGRAAEEHVRGPSRARIAPRAPVPVPLRARGPSAGGPRRAAGAGRSGGSGARSPQVHRWEDVRYPFVTRGNPRRGRWVPASL